MNELASIVFEQVSFEDVLESKLDSLNKDNDIVVCYQRGKATLYVVYLGEDCFELRGFSFPFTLALNFGECDKGRIMTSISKMISAEEAEDFRKKHFKEFLSFTNLDKICSMVAAAGYSWDLDMICRLINEYVDEGVQKEQSKQLPLENEYVYAKVQKELSEPLPLENTILSVLKLGKTVVLTNKYRYDDRQMIAFRRVGNDYYVKSFSTDLVMVGLEDVAKVLLSEENCTHASMGLDKYKLPYKRSEENGYLHVNTEAMNSERLISLLSELRAFEWSCTLCDLDICPFSDKEKHQNRCSEDNRFLIYYYAGKHKISFSDIVKSKLDDLDEENDCFSIKMKNSSLMNVRYLAKNSFECSCTDIDTGRTNNLDNAVSTYNKAGVSDILQERVGEKEQEDWQQKNMKEYLSLNLSKDFVFKLATEGITLDMYQEYLNCFTKEYVLEISASTLASGFFSLTEKVLRTLYNGKTFVLINNSYNDSRIMIVFTKVGKDLCVKSFEPSSPNIHVEDIKGLHFQKANHRHFGTDYAYILPNNGCVHVKTKKIEKDELTRIVTNLREREWSCSISDSVDIKPFSDTNADRSEEDNSYLSLYIHKRCLSLENKVARVLNGRVMKDLLFDEKISGIKKASYVFDITTDDKSIYKILLSFSQNEDDENYVDIFAIIVYRKPDGTLAYIEIKPCSKAFVIDASAIKTYSDKFVIEDGALTVNPEKGGRGFWKDLIERMLEEECQLNRLEKIRSFLYIIDPEKDDVHVYTNSIVLPIMDEFAYSYYKYIHCQKEFDTFEDAYWNAESIEQLISDCKNECPFSYEALKKQVNETYEKDYGDLREGTVDQENPIFMKLYQEKVKELHYFINTYEIIVSKISNVDTVKMLLREFGKKEKWVLGWQPRSDQ